MVGTGAGAIWRVSVPVVSAGLSFAEDFTKDVHLDISPCFASFVRTEAT